MQNDLKNICLEEFNKKIKTYGEWFQKSLGTKFIDKSEKNILLIILKSLNKNNIKIAEIGPGKGRIAQYLLQNLSISSYWGIELSPLMAKELSKQRINKLKIKVADGSEFQLKEKVDAIISIRQIKYNHKYKDQLGAMYKCLKKDGIAIVEFPSSFSVSKIRNLFFGVNNGLFNPFKFRKTTEKIGFDVTSMTALRFLPDNVYIVTNNRFLLQFLIMFEDLLCRFLPYYFGKSIILTGKRTK